MFGPFPSSFSRLQDRHGDTESLDFFTPGMTRMLCELEVRPQQDPSRLQCAFSALLLRRRQLSLFQTELVMNTRTIVADMRQGVLKIREDTDCESLVVRDTRVFLPLSDSY